MMKNEKKEYHHEYYLANRKKILARVRQYWLDHKAKVAVYGRQYRQDNKEKIAEYMSQYSKNNKERLRAGSNRYDQTKSGKESKRRRYLKRRALKAKVKWEDFGPEDIFKRDAYVCQLCGRKTRPDFKNIYHPLYPNLDHIIPISKGGEHTKLNAQCLCHECNITKSNVGKGDQLRLFG